MPNRIAPYGLALLRLVRSKRKVQCVLAFHQLRMGGHDAGGLGTRRSAWRRAVGVAVHCLSELAQDERFWHTIGFGRSLLTKAGVSVTGFRVYGGKI